MFICDNSECGIWLHRQCLIDSALTLAYERLTGTLSKNGTLTQAKKKGPKKHYSGKLSGKLLETDASEVMIEITDLRAGMKRATWTEPASCLKCDTILLR